MSFIIICTSAAAYGTGRETVEGTAKARRIEDELNTPGPDHWVKRRQIESNSSCKHARRISCTCATSIFTSTPLSPLVSDRPMPLMQTSAPTVASPRKTLTRLSGGRASRGHPTRVATGKSREVGRYQIVLNACYPLSKRNGGERSKHTFLEAALGHEEILIYEISWRSVHICAGGETLWDKEEPKALCLMR
jgi:hypothetical protein